MRDEFHHNKNIIHEGYAYFNAQFRYFSEWAHSTAAAPREALSSGSKFRFIALFKLRSS